MTLSGWSVPVLSSVGKAFRTALKLRVIIKVRGIVWNHDMGPKAASLTGSISTVLNLSCIVRIEIDAVPLPHLCETQTRGMHIADIEHVVLS